MGEEPRSKDEGGDKDSSGGGITFRGAPLVTWTEPDPITLHPITTEQVQAISRGPDDQSLSIALGLGGVAGGLLQNVIAVITSVSSSKAPTNGDLVLGSLCLVLGGIALAKLSEYKRNKPLHDALMQKVLGRKIRSGD